jgi:murein DD-endopeptidase MepM/ murein hydrolase activator NlpD
MNHLKYIVLFVSFSGCAYLPIQDQHTVKKGETLERISKRYQLSRRKIASLNKWADISKLLPEENIVYLTAPRSGLKTPYSYTQNQTNYRKPLNRFIWPLHGRLTSKFGHRWGSPHHGIDIQARRGTAIKASAPGRVIYSGKESGYGNLVIVYHGAGYSTIYAHASKLLTKKGRRVKRGQIIALVGSTGRSTGPHLHYEIRKRKAPVNPIQYLPKI